MTFIKARKEYLATVTDGSASLLREKESGVSLEVAEGKKHVVMQHIYTNMESLGNRDLTDECIVSPVVSILVREITDSDSEEDPYLEEVSDSGEIIKGYSPDSGLQVDMKYVNEGLSLVSRSSNRLHYKYNVTLPHYIEDQAQLDLIQVKLGGVRGELKTVQKTKPLNNSEPYCEVFSDHVILYTNHFCDVFCTFPVKVCASRVLAIPFGQIDTEPGREETYAKVKTYLCSHLYQNETLKKV